MTLPAHKKTRQRLAVLFSVPLAFSLVFFFVNKAAEHRENKLRNVQDLTQCVIQLRAHASEADAGERGYYLTGGQRYLLPLRQVEGTLPELIRRSQQQANEHKTDQARINRITDLVKARVDEADASVQRKQLGQLTDVQEASLLIQEQDAMDEIRMQTSAALLQLQGEQLAMLDNQQTLSRLSFVFFSIGSLIMIGVIIWLYNTLLRYLYERDLANENLKTANILLETRIEERTRDLSHANEELQQFAYVASHDLQEPLRTITSFSQLLVARYKGRLDGDADEFIGYIVSSSRRMTDLINGLLALVRLRKSGQSTVAVSFENLLSQSQISLQASIRESNATIEHGPLPSLVVDSVQLSQVLQNLISNAIKYRREEPPHIRVEAEKDSSNWIFSVKDNGRGFDPQFAERIFGLFQRLQNREIDGTGMGLSISRKIVERHGGRMWAKSDEGVGSTFFFSLPVTLERSRDNVEGITPNELTQTR